MSEDSALLTVEPLTYFFSAKPMNDYPAPVPSKTAKTWLLFDPLIHVQ